MIVGWIKRKIYDRAQRQIDSGYLELDIVDVSLHELANAPSCYFLYIDLNIYSAIPVTLHTRRIIGRTQVNGTKYMFDWDKEGETIYHHTIKDITVGKNQWTICIYLPHQQLEKISGTPSNHCTIRFVSIFQDGLSKIFDGYKVIDNV